MMIYPRLRVEVSYSSTLIMMWALLLAVMSWHADRAMQGLNILVLSSVALTSPHGESHMLFPMLFLSELLLGDSISIGHPPLDFYASTLLSYLTLVICRGVRAQTTNRNIYLESVKHATVGIGVVYFICKDRVVSFGTVAFVLSGVLFFLALLPVLGENEAVLISSLVGFYICDMVTNNSIRGRKVLLHTPGLTTTKEHIAGRTAMLCSIYMAIVLYIGSRYCMVPSVNISKSSERVFCVRHITIFFCSSLVCIVAAMYGAVSFQFEEDALMWMIKYITSAPYRLYILIIWVVTIPLSVISIEYFTHGLRKTARRKLFHFVAVAAFTPVALVDPVFLSVSLSIASTLAILIELMRFYGVYGSVTVNLFMRNHIDCRDSVHGAIRTHIYLIYSLGFATMMRYRYEQPEWVVGLPHCMELSINIIPGIVALGIVDACAGIIGSTFFLSYRRALGRYLNGSLFTERANSSITHKTTTGTLGGLLCGLLFWFLVLLIAGALGEVGAMQSFLLILVCSLAECFMDGIDNLQLPLVVSGVTYTVFAILMRRPTMP